MANLAQSARQYLNAALGLLYPEVCQLCSQSRATPAEGFVCSNCRDTVRFVQPPFCDRCGLPFEGHITTTFECSNCRDTELYFKSARSAVIARDGVLEAIHKYKYERALWFEPFLADLLVGQARPDFAASPPDLIVPVPLHAAKLREREFNQAERLGRCMATALDIPIDPGLVRRVVPTQTQTLLSRDERRANIRNAFAMCPDAQLHGQRVVVVDDVFTTGATTSALARVLLKGGAAEVCVWTVARGV
jgi:ComF family protein